MMNSRLFRGDCAAAGCRKGSQRILAVCSLPLQLSDRELYVTASIGISIFPNDGEDMEVLLKNAERGNEPGKGNGDK
jgi:GGDEF domain-containing protein